VICIVCLSVHQQSGGCNCAASNHSSVHSLYSYHTQGSVFGKFVIHFHGDKVEISFTISPPEGSNKCLWNVYFSWYHCISADRRHLFPHHRNTAYSTKLFHSFQKFLD
jgi:hypothetical protein